MSEKKSITIDSQSLAGGGSKRKSSRRGSDERERKIRPSSIVQPSTLKKTLLERIKQHQRTRERSREQRRDDNTAATDDTIVNTHANDNFTQSIDFLRKLAMKRRQQQQQQYTHKRPHTSSSSSSSVGGEFTDAKTPEAKMLNQVAATLHNGEILTNTGLLGLPVVPMVLPQQQHISPMISLESMPMPMPMQYAQSIMPASAITNMTSHQPPNITQLADMYNNTIASASSAISESTAPSDATVKEPPLHIPTKPEDYLPSIFIKEEPPHGCLKNGTKPTFREWATNMLKKPVDTFKNMIGGGSPSEDGEVSGDQSSGVGGVGGGGEVNKGLSGEFGGVNPEQVAGMRVKIRKTHKKRFRIGKHDDVVGVLLKNKQTQRHIQNQHLTLKQKTIGEIRKYLYEHHLLKIGSNAPPDVLRRMYEDSILTGDVKNTNKDVLLHNFMSGGGGGGGGGE
jgi:hypothetical protein